MPDKLRPSVVLFNVALTRTRDSLYTIEVVMIIGEIIGILTELQHFFDVLSRIGQGSSKILAIRPDLPTVYKRVTPPYLPWPRLFLVDH